MTMLRVMRMLLLVQWICTAQGIDELTCHGPDGSTTTGSDNCFKCVATNEVIFFEAVCDGLIHCGDFSDECLCSRQTVPDEICNTLYDPNTAPSPNCGIEQDFSKCHEIVCRNKTTICGDSTECLQYANEKLSCSQKSTEKNESVSVQCLRTSKDHRSEVITATICDGIIECDSREDECRTKCFEHAGSRIRRYCENDFTCLPGSWICDGEWDSPKAASCNGVSIDDEEIGCDDRFYCQRKLSISIKSSKVCDYDYDCDDGSDESIDRNCTDGRYYCHDYEYLAIHNTSEIETAFIRRSQLFDGQRDCTDGRDECHIGPLSFHSETEMVSSTALRIMVWISGTAALLGNISVIYFTLHTVVSQRKLLNKISRGYHTLLLTLSFADLLMSIYLLSVGVKSLMFSGEYCEEDLQWRSSATCTALGVISMISSEMSVTVMLIMSMFRFVTISKPLLTYKSKATDYAVKVSVTIAWILAILISIMPLLGEMGVHFTHEVAINCHVFDSHVVKIDAVKSTINKYVTLMRKTNSTLSVSTPKTIPEMNLILGSICPHGSPPQWFGFYGQNSVCMPRIFARPSDPIWQVSITLVVYNLLAFFTLFIFYALIIRVTVSKSKHLGQESIVPKCKLQARVTRLLVSDFACWIPVCIIGILYASGESISPNLYATCGIVLLPINSALNPFLYSSYCDKLIGAVLGLCWKDRPDLSEKACTMSKVASNRDHFRVVKNHRSSSEFSDLIGQTTVIKHDSNVNH